MEITHLKPVISTEHVNLITPLQFGAQAEQQPPSEITLKLPMQMMLVIAKGIQELPYKEASPVLNEVQRQVNEQLAPKVEPEKKP